MHDLFKKKMQGATISSVSVCDIVNGTVGRLKAELVRERRQ